MNNLLLKFKNNIALQTYLLLISGLLMIGVLLVVIQLEYSHLLRSKAINPYIHMRIMNIAKDAINNPAKTTIEQLQELKFLQPSIQVVNQLPLHIPILKRDAPPFIFDEAFAISLPQQQWIIVKINPRAHLNKLHLLYGSAMIILIGSVLLLCFWAIKRINQPYAFISAALTQLAQNINSSLVTPSNHPSIQQIANKILIIQNQLKKNLHKRTQILAAISHDLRTPITKLKLRAELLSDEKTKERMLHDLIEVETMLNSVLIFSKDFIQEEMAVRFNFSDLIQVVCDDFIDQGHDIKTDIQANIQYQGRMLALKRSIQNIVDNAIKYGQKDIHVSLLQQPDKKIILTISDHGSGVPEHQLKEMFEPFVRLDPSRNQTAKGSGLGLSISEEIILSHGGMIQAQNIKPHGLKIKIVL